MKVTVPVVLSVALLVASCTTTDNLRKVDLSKAAQHNANLAFSYLNEGELQLAKLKAEKAIDQDKNNALANSMNGSIQQRLGNTEKAEQFLRRAVELAPDQPEYANGYGVFLCEEGRVQDGVKQFVAVAENPLHRSPALAYENAAMCALKDKSFELAEQFLMQSLKVKPDYAKARYELAELQLRSKKYVEALANIERLESENQMSAAVASVGARAAKALNRPVVAEHFIYILETGYPDSYQARSLSN